MQDNSYLLPDGSTCTNSRDEYMTAWQDLVKPLLDATGLELRGFNPGYLLGSGNYSIDLPTWFVSALSAFFQGDPTKNPITIARKYHLKREEEKKEFDILLDKIGWVRSTTGWGVKQQ